jgi:tripartite-type tricarboxylate transporter receptor subunit TctC
MERVMHRALQFLLLAFVLGPGPAARADDFYKGKTITLVVANAAGGGYDLYARLLARHMGRHIPGEPSIIVKYQPGAGGLVMANAIYGTAPRDGLTIGLMARANPLERALDNPAAKFENESFTWLGTASSFADDAYCLVIRADSSVRSIADADLLLVARDVFGLNLQLVRGYGGVPDINIAMRRGEVDGQAVGMSALRNSMADWLTAGKLRFLLQFGHDTRWQGLPDVPSAHELARTPADQALIALAELPLKMARPFIAPPDLPPARAAILKEAFMATQRDPAYRRDANELQVDISPLAGEEIAQILQRLARSPPDLIRRYKVILAAK